jgi:hypothetical protein
MRPALQEMCSRCGPSSSLPPTACGTFPSSRSASALIADTIARVIVILRFMFNLARKWKILKGHDNPAAGIPVPPDVQRNRFLDKAKSKD